MEFLRKLGVAAALVTWRELRARPAVCPLCGPSIIVQLQATALGVRCLRCGASAITMSLVSVLQSEIGELAALHVYELSSRGPLVNWLGRRAGKLTCSEYFDDVPPGSQANGVQCQDVQRLTYASSSFDVCTSTEVLEHVPDDARAFAELHRVLRPGGRLVFSVPLSPATKTVERAVRNDGVVHHLLPPEYHGDKLRGQARVLAYRNYGLDIADTVAAQGFRNVRLVKPTHAIGPQRQSIVVGTA